MGALITNSDDLKEKLNFYQNGKTVKQSGRLMNVIFILIKSTYLCNLYHFLIIKL